jgi:hypothetical protein
MPVMLTLAYPESCRPLVGESPTVATAGRPRKQIVPDAGRSGRRLRIAGSQFPPGDVLCSSVAVFAQQRTFIRTLCPASSCAGEVMTAESQQAGRA